MATTRITYEKLVGPAKTLRRLLRSTDAGYVLESIQTEISVSGATIAENVVVIAHNYTATRQAFAPFEVVDYLEEETTPDTSADRALMRASKLEVNAGVKSEQLEEVRAKFEEDTAVHKDEQGSGIYGAAEAGGPILGDAGTDRHDEPLVNAAPRDPDEQTPEAVTKKALAAHFGGPRPKAPVPTGYETLLATEGQRNVGACVMGVGFNPGNVDKDVKPLGEGRQVHVD